MLTEQHSTRYIGIQHRIKRTKAGEAHPTRIAIVNAQETRTFELPDETAELDFVLGRFPIKHRAVKPGEDLTPFKHHHIQWRKLKDDETIDCLPVDHVLKEGKTAKVAHRVPAAYDGLQQGDVVAMSLGGSGDYLAYAIARRGQDISATLLRIPPFALKNKRNSRGKEDDAALLATLAAQEPALFNKVTPREQQFIQLRVKLVERINTMKDRIRCEQRMGQHGIGQIFCSTDGLFPEGTVKKEVERRKTNNASHQAILAEEQALEKELIKIVKGLDVYQQMFEPIEGCGPLLATRIIGNIPNICCFPTYAKLKAYCGVHLLDDGRFPRRRNNEVANWNDECRKGLYLLADQFNRRPESEWGKKLRENKTRLRERHPEPVLTERGTTDWNDMHIHKTAIWRTLSQFVRWLWHEWRRLEAQQSL